MQGSIRSLGIDGIDLFLTALGDHNLVHMELLIEHPAVSAQHHMNGIRRQSALSELHSSTVI